MLFRSTDAQVAKEVEDQMYDIRVKGRMIKPDDHKRTDGHHAAVSSGNAGTVASDSAQKPAAPQ